MNDAAELPSIKPYLIRAWHEWCTDHGFTAYLAVRVDKSVQVPREYVKEGEIVLNVSYDATGGLQLGDDFIEFKARFGGKPVDILVPVARVQAIYARENGQGMAFPEPDADVLMADAGDDLAAAAPAGGRAPAEEGRVVQLVPSGAGDGDKPLPPPPGSGRPALKRVK